MTWRVMLLHVDVECTITIWLCVTLVCHTSTCKARRPVQLPDDQLILSTSTKMTHQP